MTRVVAQTVGKKKYDQLKPAVFEYLRTKVKKSHSWSTCFALKQRITSSCGFFYQEDMAKYCREYGIEVKKVEGGRYWVRADYIHTISQDRNNFKSDRRKKS